MSEYMEKHSVAKLVGAPPGYIGHEEGGQLTGKLRRRPYAVVLLDEIEKAHPEVFDLFLQVFDEGRLTDSHGRTVDARNAIFIMTSNIIAGASAHRPLGFTGQEIGEEKEEAEGRGAVMGELRRIFRPEFLNRIDEIILFRSLGVEDLSQVVRKMLAALRDRVEEQGISLEISEEAVRLICTEGYDPANGARPLARTIERLIGRPLSELLVSGAMRAGDNVRVDVEGGKIEFRQLQPEGSGEETL